MHLYEVVGSQRGQKLKCHASNKMETLRITSFNDRQEYMLLCDPQQEDSSEYQQPQQCGSNTKTAENKEGTPEFKGDVERVRYVICIISRILDYIYKLLIIMRP